MLKYLRIAVTALSLAACVLLITLWERSYRRIDKAIGLKPNSAIGVGIFSEHGRVAMASTADWQTLVKVTQWELRSEPVKYINRQFSMFGGFGYVFGTRETALVAPHWFLVLLFAIFAAAPLVRPTTRFSLRALLIATTLIAVGLGAIISTS